MAFFWFKGPHLNKYSEPSLVEWKPNPKFIIRANASTGHNQGIQQHRSPAIASWRPITSMAPSLLYVKLPWSKLNKREKFFPLVVHLQTTSSWMPYRGPILRSLWVGGRQRMMWRLAFTRVIKNFIGSAKKLENFFLIAGIKAWQNETNTQATTVNFLLSSNMKMRNLLLFCRVRNCFPNINVSLIVTVVVLEKHTIIRCSFNRKVTNY